MPSSVPQIDHTVIDIVDNEEKREVKNEGVLYPFYLPNYDLNEKFPPIELLYQYDRLFSHTSQGVVNMNRISICRMSQSQLNSCTIGRIDTVYEYSDPGLRANPAKPNLLKENAMVNHISPYIGTEIAGVQISQLTKEGLDELGLYAAERKVVIFRDQDFKDLNPERQIEIAKHFGPLHQHAVSGNVKGYPEFHIVYRDPQHDRFKGYIDGDRMSYISWHSDGSYEKQPPGITFFFILEQPELGGDTLFLSQVEAYQRLSPEFQKRLEGLRVIHSALAQAESSKKFGRPVRREPIETEHPLVRVHPVTGEKSLFINEGFTKRIVGFKREESEYLLRFLYDHMAKESDFQIRASYRPGTVVVWDNRTTAHSAMRDFSPTFRRHAVRLTPMAEIPIPATT